MTEPLSVPSSDGVTLAVHDLSNGRDGERGDDALLVCHATGFCGWAYAPLADELSSRFHVYAIDFRGHGDSTAPANGNFNWGSMADDLLAVVDALADLGAGPITGFGHSLGGGVLMLAERRRPGTIRSAYLYEPILLPSPADRAAMAGAESPANSPQGPDMMSIAARKRRASFPSKAEALERYASRPPLNTLQAGALAAYVEHGMAEGPDGQVYLKCTPENEAATFEADGKPTLDLLAPIETPTTIAIGTTGRGWTPASFGPLAAEALRNGRLERHPLLGHFGPLQGPITVGAMVLEATDR